MVVTVDVCVTEPVELSVALAVDDTEDVGVMVVDADVVAELDNDELTVDVAVEDCVVRAQVRNGPD